MSELSEIIERLEQATGPDREIDGVLALLLGWTFQKMKGDARAYYRKPGVTEYYMRSECPDYTASLDAALTLVPEGLHWSLNSRGVARVGGAAREYMIKGGEHSTPAIALCIAALKARLSSQKEG